jgi:Fe-S-cluster containining protein
MKPSRQASSLADGSRLCLTCGLCCQGLLHDWARLREDEAGAAARLGLRTELRDGEVLFALPCPCHQEGRCTVYEERLSPCRDYRCKLLRDYQSDQVSWEEALRRVEQARRLVAAIQGRLGAPGSGGSLWQQVRAAASTDADALLEISALLTHCQRYFWTRMEPRKTFVG